MCREQRHEQHRTASGAIVLYFQAAMLIPPYTLPAWPHWGGGGFPVHPSSGINQFHLTAAYAPRGLPL